MNNFYLIWSFKHNAWWAENSNGYTTIQKKAGVYMQKEALEICFGANRGLLGYEKPNEAMIPLPRPNTKPLK